MMNEHALKLKMLSTCYYVIAIVYVFAALLPVILLSVNSGSEYEIIQMYLSMAVGELILSLIIAAVIATVGYALRKLRWRKYCATAAVLVSLLFPAGTVLGMISFELGAIGTVLGICTLIVLVKPEAKQLFTQPAH